MLEVTSTNINEVMEQSFHSVVVIDFFAPWCGPCQTVARILEMIGAEYGDKIIVAKCDVDAEEEIAAEQCIRNIPTICIYKNGEAVRILCGALPKGKITEALDEILSM